MLLDKLYRVALADYERALERASKLYRVALANYERALERDRQARPPSPPETPMPPLNHAPSVAIPICDLAGCQLAQMYLPNSGSYMRWCSREHALQAYPAGRQDEANTSAQWLPGNQGPPRTRIPRKASTATGRFAYIDMRAKDVPTRPTGPTKSSRIGTKFQVEVRDDGW